MALNAEGYLDTSSNESFNKDEFKGIKDIFGGITINTDAEKCESNEDFERKLASWFPIPPYLSNLHCFNSLASQR